MTADLDLTEAHSHIDHGGQTFDGLPVAELLARVNALVVLALELQAATAVLAAGGGLTPPPGRDPGRISLKEAAALAGRSERTIVRWCEQFGIGFRAPKHWVVIKSDLEKLIGKFPAADFAGQTPILPEDTV